MNRKWLKIIKNEKKLKQKKQTNKIHMDLNETNNAANNSTFEIGGLAYFLLYISDYLPHVVIYALGTFFGFIGNLELGQSIV